MLPIVWTKLPVHPPDDIVASFESIDMLHMQVCITRLAIRAQ